MDSYVNNHEGRGQKVSQHDIGKLIQSELAKCMENILHQQSAMSGQKNDVNMIQEGSKKQTSFDGHSNFNVLPSMEKTEWIVDSRASSHICCNLELLHTTYKLDSPTMIFLPDGTSRLVAFAGNARVNKEIMLKDV